MTTSVPLRLFEGVGIEIEYMIVDQSTLGIRPLADELLKTVRGRYEMEIDLGIISWSNELALHVIELKTTDPVPSLHGLDQLFQEHVSRIELALAPMSARLLPTAMHPWMDPNRELRLWPHEADVIYATFDRIFNCKGHGWANLQCVHVNLPFGDDDEFGRLHAAVRLVLPILPGLAASSPMADGRLTGLMDTRVEMYRQNAARIPSVTGRVVPEAVFTRAEYEAAILGRIYDDLAPYDPDGILRHEWVNARGCIARFDRMALEIRLIDAQECPQADVAVAAAVVGVIRALVEERWSASAAQRAWDETTLAGVLAEVVRGGDRALIRDDRYLAAFGFPGRAPCSARELWHFLVEQSVDATANAGWQAWFEIFATQGCLARRISDALGPAPLRERVEQVYHRLAGCLRTGQIFRRGDV